MAVEKLVGIEVPIRAQYIRVLFSEITRARPCPCSAARVFILSPVRAPVPAPPPLQVIHPCTWIIGVG